jgi:PKD repeat protein
MRRNDLVQARHDRRERRRLGVTRRRSLVVAVGFTVSTLLPVQQPGVASAQPVCPDGAIEWKAATTTGTWSTPTNWEGDQVPTAADDVCIPTGVTVTVNSVADANRLVSLGNLTMTSQSLDLGAPSEITGTFTMSGGTLKGDGSLSLGGPASWSSGTFESPVLVGETSTLTLTGFSAKSLTSTLTNEGLVSQEGGLAWASSSTSAAGTVVNNGIWRVVNSGTLMSTPGPRGTFINHGRLSRDGVAGQTTTISGFAVDVVNHGVIETIIGNMAITGSTTGGGSGLRGWSDGATLAAAADSTLEVTGNTTAETTGGTLSVVGSGVVILRGVHGLAADATIDLPDPGVQINTDGNTGIFGGSVDVRATADWITGILDTDVVVHEGAELVVGPGSSSKTLRGTMVNHGAVSQTGANVYVSGANVVNGGSWTITTETSIAISAGPFGSPIIPSEFVNNGSLKRSASTGSGNIEPSITVTNNGVVSVDGGGDFGIRNTTNLVGGTLTGRWVASDGSRLRLNDNAQVNVNDAELTFSGAGSGMSNLATFAGGLGDNQGSLVVTDGATFETNGALDNTGTIVVGPASTVTVSGALDTSGILSTRIGGIQASELFGAINVLGGANLGGTFRVELVDGFEPPSGEGYQVMAFEGRDGSDFGTYEGLEPWFTKTLTLTNLFLNSGNLEPVAVITGPTTVTEGDPDDESLWLQLDGTGSFDPDGEIVSYSWAPEEVFDDPSSATPRFTAIADDATVVITLQVCDNGNPQQCDTDTATVTVENAPPVVTALVAEPLSIDEGDTIDLDLATFTDPGLLDTHTAVISWGDGQSTNLGSVDRNEPIGGTHTYLRDGNFTIRVTVTDNDGGSDSAEIPVSVANVPPTVLPNDDVTVDEGDGNTVLVLATYTDPGVQDVHTATIDWGDDSDVESATVNQATNTVTGSHVYRKSGTYNATVCVDDGGPQGAVCEPLTIVVLNVAPTVDAGDDIEVGSDGQVNLQVTFTDPGIDDTHTATVNWGDDSSLVELGPVTSPFGVPHTYPGAGIYTAEVCVTDDDGAFGCDSVEITVSNTPPEVDAGGPYSGFEGTPIAVSGTASDPDGEVVSTEWSAAVGTFDDPDSLTTTFTAPNDGVYEITLTACDDDGDCESDTVEVTVADVPTTIVDLQVTSPVDEGSVASLTAAFTDPGVFDLHTATVDWGDGSDPIAADVDPLARTVAAEHVYADDDTYTVTLTVCDVLLPDACDVATFEVVVENAAPTITALSAPAATAPDSLVEIKVEFTDPGVRDAHTATVDWGDGTALAELGDVDSPFVATHVYETPGPFTITVCVIDNGGLFDCAEVTILVTDGPSAVDDVFDVPEGEGDRILDVLANDSGTGIQIVGNTQPSAGSVSCTQTECVYSGEVDFAGETTFEYTISDGALTDTATVTVAVVACADLTGALNTTVTVDGEPVDLVTGTTWIECADPSAHAVAGSDLTPLMQPADSLALLTTGRAADAFGVPGNTADTDHGRESRGAFDVSTLRVDLDIPELIDVTIEDEEGEVSIIQVTPTCLSFDVVFASAEYLPPDFLNKPYNDAFLAELGASDWSVSGSVITAERNFALGADGEVLSVRGGFFDLSRVITETGMSYNGSTALLKARTPITPGSHQLFLSIFDGADGNEDSAALIDNIIVFETVACDPGLSQPPVAVDDEFEIEQRGLPTAWSDWRAADGTIVIDVLRNDQNDRTPGSLTVLENDFDPDGDEISILRIVRRPQHGMAFVSGDRQSILYVPNEGFSGPDQFEYSLTDRANASEREPVDAVSIATVDVLVDSEPLRIVSNTDPDNGGVASCTATSCTYTPPSGNPPDRFSYTISNERAGDPDWGGTSTASVWLNQDFPEPPAPFPPPVADAGGPYEIGACDEPPCGVQLDGTASFHPDPAASITSWFWSISLPWFVDVEAPAFLEGADTPTPTFFAEQDGVYRITLFVCDNRGMCDFDRTVVISFVANVTSPIDEGSDATVSVDFFNPGGDLRVEIDWRDGTAVESIDPAIFPVSTTRTFPQDGDVDLSVCVRGDILGDEIDVCDAPSLEVRNVLPVVDAGVNRSLLPGRPLRQSRMSFFDPGADAPWTATIDFGDESEPVSLLVNQATQQLFMQEDYVYEEIGVYTVRVCVTDDKGPGCDDFTVTVSNNAPPTADAGGPYTSDEGEAIQLDGTNSFDPEEGELSYTWSVDGDSTRYELDGANTAAPTFTGLDDGTFTVVLQVCDDGTPIACSDVDVTTVTVANVAPTVSLDAPGSVLTVDTVVVEVTFTDPGVLDTHSATIDWDDGTITELATVVSPFSPTHVYAAEGQYTINVCVTDNSGDPETHTGCATAVVNVFDDEIPDLEPPVADPGGPYGADEGQTIVLDGGGSYDPEGDELTYLWSTEADAALVVLGDVDSAAPSFLGVDDGDYAVTLVVCAATDPERCSDPVEVTVTVANVAPTVESVEADTPIDEGDTTTLTVEFTDPGVRDTHRATIDWGDGSTTELDEVTSPFEESHTYVDDGEYTVTVTVCDNADDCGVGTTVVDVTNVAPTVSLDAPGSALTGETVAVEVTFTDPGVLDTHSATIDWDDGTITELATVVSPFSPTHVYAGEGEFTIEVCVTDNSGDPETDTDCAMAVITVSAPLNQPPVAFDGAVSTPVDTAVMIFLDAFDPDGDPITFEVVDQPASGSLECDLGVCVYTPDEAFTGNDSFTFRVFDGEAFSNVATVAISVGQNEPPIAVDDEFVVPEGSGQRRLSPLDNDVDPDGDELVIVANTQPDVGSVECSSWDCTFTGEAGFVGETSFEYTISDGFGDVDSATVTIIVQACPNLIGAIDDTGLVVGQEWVECSAVDANGTAGPELTPLFPVTGDSLLLMTTGATEIAFGPNDSPSAGRDNRTQFRGAFDASVFRLDLVIPDGANCVAFDLMFGSEEYPEFVGSAFNDGFLAELGQSTWSVFGSAITAPDNFAFDADGNVISINSAFFDPDRVITDSGMQYDGVTPLLRIQTPVTSGPQSIYLSIFDASDGIYDSGALIDGLVALAVPPGSCVPGANEAPAAVDDEISTDEDTPIDIDVLANDFDADGDALTIVSVTQPANGTVTIISTEQGQVINYSPDQDWFGVDTFTYTITDGRGGFDTATVTVTVLPVNDPPVADAGGPYEMVEGDTITLDGTGSFDVDDTELTYTWTVDVGPPLVQLSDVDTSTPSFAAFDDGMYTVTLRVCDPHDECDEDAATVTVVNAPPVVILDAPEFALTGAPTSVEVTFTDPGVFDFHTGTIDWGDGTIVDLGAVESPFEAFHVYAVAGEFTIQVCVTDNSGDPDTERGCATAQISVAPVGNEPPVIEPIADVFVDEGDVVVVEVVVTDPDGDPVTVTVIGLPGFAEFDVTTSTVAVAPGFDDAGEYGPVTVTAADGINPQVTETFSITVIDVNRRPIADPGGPYFADEGEVVVLDGTGSSDPDGDGLTYVWTTDADVEVVVLGAADTATPTFLGVDDGSYTVSLVVCDDGEPSLCSDPVSTTVTVANVAPVIVLFEGDTAIDEGGSTTVFATFVDPGVRDVHTAVVDWGDGADAVAAAIDPASNTVIASYTYLDDGEYSVTLTVCDNAGDCDDENLLVTVSNVAPVVTLDAPAVTLTEVTTSVGVSFTDPGVLDFHTAVINWGDGTIVDLGAVESPFEATHVYAVAGGYTIQVCVTDNSGDPDTDTGCDTTTIAVRVTAVAPVAVIAGPETGDEGERLRYDGSGSSPAPGSGIGSYIWVVLDDGRTFTGAQVQITFPDNGTYSIQLTVCDASDPDLCGSSVLVVSIANLPPTVRISRNSPNSPLRINTNVAKTASSPIMVPLAVQASDVEADLPLRFDWILGDGATRSGVNLESLSHGYRDLGRHIPSVTVRDKDGGSAQATFRTVTVLAEGRCTAAQNSINLTTHWGLNARVTAYGNNADIARIVGSRRERVGKARPGDVYVLRTNRNAPAVQAACINGKRWLGVVPLGGLPPGTQGDLYIEESKLVRLP